MKPRRHCLYSFWVALVCGVGASVHTTLYTIVIGSYSAISQESAVIFPAKDHDNEIRGFAELGHGFVLEDASTTCTYNSIFGITGEIALNGGTLFLNRDLGLNNISTFTSLGTIYGNTHAIDLASRMHHLGAASNVVFYCDTLRINMNTDVTLHAPLCFEGICTIDGRYNDVTLDATGSIIVGQNSSLLIKNITLKGIAGDNVRCADNTGVLTLQDVVWQQDASVTFSSGGIRFSKNVVMQGNETNFAYQSQQTSTVLGNTVLDLDGSITFSYDSDAKNRFEFVDASSMLTLNDGATLHATGIGMTLIKGTLRIKEGAYFSSEGAGGITLGNENIDDDMIFMVGPGVNVSVWQGSLNYKNVDLSSCCSGNTMSTLWLEAGTKLRLYQTLSFSPGRVQFEPNASMARAPGARLIAETSIVETM